MCPPTPKTPPPPAKPPAAPPPPSETAAGYAAADTDASGLTVNKRRGLDSLRVDLAVPGGGQTGLNVPS